MGILEYKLLLGFGFFSSLKQLFTRKWCFHGKERAVCVSSHGVVSADLQGNTWLCMLLLQPLEGLV